MFPLFFEQIKETHKYILFFFEVMERMIRIVACFKFLLSSLMFLLLIVFMTACTLGNRVPIIPQEEGNFSVHMCPVENCSQVLREEIMKSTSVSCAFYDISDAAIIKALEEKKARVVIDDENFFGLGRKVHAKGIMHDKFCIFDNKRVLTGSYNPTAMGERHANNLVIVSSQIIAKNYQDEFEELWKDVSQKEKQQVHQPMVNVSGTVMEMYFCPEDNCELHVLETIKEAKVSVHFMTFAFTSDPIGEYLASVGGNNGLLAGEKNSGRSSKIDVKGVFEKQQISEWSEYARLNVTGIKVIIDDSPYLMHNQVFIIDRKVVITGSFNPSKNADTNNDENVFIIRNAVIAEEYEKEFERLFS